MGGWLEIEQDDDHLDELELEEGFPLKWLVQPRPGFCGLWTNDYCLP